MQILKLGGSVITKKHEHMTPDIDSIERLAKAIAAVWHAGKKDLIIVHGAGSFGHILVMTYGLNNGIKDKKEKLGYAYTHSSCGYLSSLLVDALIKHDVPAVSLPPAAIIRQNNKRISEFNQKLVFDYLKEGYLPILHGDMVLDKKLGGSVCSGDQIVAFLGKKASRIVIGTNVDGVLVDGKVVPKITSKNFNEIKKHLKQSGAPDVTGGMAGKINELLNVKKPVFIANANRAERIEALLLGNPALCTEIKF
ncbi:MAG: isopentenyl phosphate kinase [Candidatus Micrarchaeota archaeon]